MHLVSGAEVRRVLPPQNMVAGPAGAPAASSSRPGKLGW